MAQRSVVIASPVGLHARPAALFAAAAGKAGMPVTIRKTDGEPVPAASILSLLTLNAAQGAEVVLEATGEGAEEVLDSLAAMLNSAGSEAASHGGSTS